MSTNPEENGQPPLVLNEKKLKRDTTSKKKGSSELEQSTLKQQPIEKEKEKVREKQPNGNQNVLLKFLKKPAIVDTTSTNSQEFITANTNQSLIQSELKKKEELIKKLYAENQNEQQKNFKAKQQFLEYCQKTKKALLDSKKQLAQIKRKQIGQINGKLGFFRDQSCSNFQEGEYVVEVKRRIGKIEAMIKQVEANRRTSSNEELTLLNSRMTFLTKQLNQLKQELQMRQKELQSYKDQLRLFFKTQNSTFARDSWPLLKNRYQPLSFIASGGYGEVYLGYDIQKYQDVAIKVCNIEKVSSQNYENQLKYLKRQIQTHKQLSHPNIVKLIDQLDFEDNNKIGFVMEYCSGPELKSYLRKEICLDEREAKFIIRQIIYAVKYLSDQKYKVIHCDLKPGNILFHNGIIKIADFGISKRIQTEDSQIDLTSFTGTYYYLPPEYFQDKTKISNKLDIWSIGVIFYEMLYGKKPFGHGMSQRKVLDSGEILKAHHVDFPKDSPKNYFISENAKSFIRKCLQYYPDQRLSPTQAYEDPYIQV